MIVSLYWTLGITLNTVRADYDCERWLFLLYKILNRTIRITALPYPKHRCRRMPAYIYIIYIYIYDLSFLFGQQFFFVSASVCDSRNWNPRSNRFVRSPSSGGGSNAPRPALSVRHLDVNADGCWARKTRSCKNIVFWNVIFRLRLYLDVCSVWMISKFGIISKR